MRKVIAGLDIGSKYIKLVVVEFTKGKANVLGVSYGDSKGVKKGVVTDPNALISSLKEVFSKCENMIGLKISKVIVTTLNEDTKFLMTEKTVNIYNEEHVVKKNDILKAMRLSTENKIDKDSELVSLEPINFIIDDERTLKNPLKQKAKTLTVKTLLVTVPRKNIYPIVKCLEKIGVQVVDFTLGVIGDYMASESSLMKDNVGAIINIGGDITSVSIFNKGILTNTSNLYLGGNNILNDFSYIYGLTMKDADVVRKELAFAHKNGTSASVRKDFTNKEGKKITISEYEASEIASSRLEEILKLAKKEINLLTKKEIHYIMITGGVSEMPQFSMLVDEVFGHEAKILNIKEIGVRSNIYSSALGMTKYYDEKTRSRGVEFSIWDAEETEELSNVNKKINFGENSILGKLFGYFFDN